MQRLVSNIRSSFLPCAVSMPLTIVDGAAVWAAVDAAAVGAAVGAAWAADDGAAGWAAAAGTPKSNPRVARFDNFANRSAAASARASPHERNSAPTSANCASRSTKNRRAPRPGGKAAGLRREINDTPPLQWGFDGPAGRRAARSA